MDRFPTELIVLIIFGVVTLFQYLTKHLRQQQQQAPASNESELFQEYYPETEQAETTGSLLDDSNDGYWSQTAVADPLPVRSQRRLSRRAVLGNRQELRKAIIMATILGPCRAFDSIGSPHG